MQCGILAGVCALVIGIYVYTAHSDVLRSGSLGAADNLYNLLAQGFRAGQLSLKKEVPPGFASLTDPYDPDANQLYRFAPYGMLDMSYYQGKLYLYFGVTPALVLFWPYIGITGHYLSYGQAGVIFCSVGFLASVYILCALWRRYFAEVNVWLAAGGALALGLGTGVPVLLARCKHNDVAIGCGYAFTMLALAGIWRVLHEPERRCRWLTAASVAYGLAVGARPSLLFGAIILLVPTAQAWRERRPILAPLLAATVPIALIGVGLMLYNFLRFDSPFEFGIRYQLALERLVTVPLFSLRYLWFNFRVYFLEPARWCGPFPFVHEATLPALPAGYGPVEDPFGALTNIPLVWLAVATPLAWSGRSGQARSVLRSLVMAVAVLFGTCALTVSLFRSAIIRYEVEFLPALVLLAVVGIFGLERTLADCPVWRRTARWCWTLLLIFSVAFNLLVCAWQCAEAHNDLGVALTGQGRLQEAIGQYEQALRIKPDDAGVHNNLGSALMGQGRPQEAIEHYEQALRLEPNNVEALFNLGLASARLGRIQEAISYYERALRINPDYAEAHFGLGAALFQVGKVQEAMEHWEQTLRIRPDYAEAHYNLGIALARTGNVQEAIQHYEQALRIKPDFVQAQNALMRARAAQ